MASYAELVAEAALFLKCESVASNLLPNAGTKGDVPITGSDPSIVTGKYDNGYQWSGTPYARIAGVAGVLFGTAGTNFSLGGWFKSNPAALDKGAFGISITWNTGTFLQTSGFIPYDVWGGGSNNGIRCYHRDNDISVPKMEWKESDDAAVADGSWHWYLYEKVGKTFSIYFDDAATAANSFLSVNHLGASTNSINVASRYTTNDRYWAFMDDVFAFPRALTTAEKVALRDRTEPEAGGGVGSLPSQFPACLPAIEPALAHNYF